MQLMTETGRVQQRLWQWLLTSLVFMVPIGEVTGSYNLPLAIKISLPNVVSLIFLMLMANDIIHKKKISREFLSTVLTLATIFVTILFLALVRVNDRHSTVIIPFIGSSILLASFQYWFDFTRHIRVLAYSFLVANVLLIASVLVFIITGYTPPTVEVDFGASLFNIPGFEFFRTTGLSGLSSGTFGSFIETGLILGLVLFNKVKTWQRFPILIISILTAIAGVFFTQSRSMLVAIVVGVVFYYFFLYLNSRGKRAKQLVFVFLLVGVVLFCVSLLSLDWLVGLRTESVDSRTETNSYAWELIRSNPMIGNGFYAVTEGFGTHHQLHNHYLAYLVALGLPVFIFYMSLYYRAVAVGLSRLFKNEEESAFMAGILGALVAVFVENNFYLGFSSPLTFILLGILLSLKNRKE